VLFRNTLAMFAVVPVEHASHTPKIVLRERKSPLAVETRDRTRRAMPATRCASVACDDCLREFAAARTARSATKKLISCCDVRREMDSIVIADGA
jgi:hypothetical protein